jgi:hypothetical protein
VDKSQLAQELRNRQLELGKVEECLINSLSDDKIIDCYITCNKCKQKDIPDNLIDWVIGKAENVEHFFQIVDQIKHGINQ